MRKVHVDIGKLVSEDKYAKMYEPLSPDEYNDLLSDIRRLGHILVPIIAEDRGERKLDMLAGHRRVRADSEHGHPVMPEAHAVETAEEEVDKARLIKNGGAN